MYRQDRQQTLVHGVTYSDIADTQLPKCQWTSVLFPLFARYFSALKTVSKSLQRVAHTTYCHIPKITMLLTEVICVYIYIYIYIFSCKLIYVTIRSYIIMQSKFMTLNEGVFQAYFTVTDC